MPVGIGSSGRRGGGSRTLGAAALPEGEEVDGLQEDGREAAVAGDVGEDRAGGRKYVLFRRSKRFILSQ